jgi:hypothetical protein
MEQTTAENEETATARYIAGHVSTQLMLKTLFEIIATMAEPAPAGDVRRRHAALGWLARAGGP